MASPPFPLSCAVFALLYLAAGAGVHASEIRLPALEVPAQPTAVDCAGPTEVVLSLAAVAASPVEWRCTFVGGAGHALAVVADQAALRLGEPQVSGQTTTLAVRLDPASAMAGRQDITLHGTVDGEVLASMGAVVYLYPEPVFRSNSGQLIGDVSNFRLLHTSSVPVHLSLELLGDTAPSALRSVQWASDEVPLAPGSNSTQLLLAHAPLQGTGTRDFWVVATVALALADGSVHSEERRCHVTVKGAPPVPEVTTVAASRPRGPFPRFLPWWAPVVVVAALLSVLVLVNVCLASSCMPKLPANKAAMPLECEDPMLWI